MNPFRSLLGLLAWVAVCFLAAATGAVWQPGEWYAGLAKPSWNPPNWIFGPVWTTLYLVMAFSAWRVWRRAGFERAGPALALFLAQLALNALWTPVFFGLHWMGVAVLVIVMLAGAIALTIAAFRRHDPLAAALLLPYLGWVCFATVLNATLWRLN